MDCYESAICRQIKTLLSESKNYANLLYSAPCIYSRNMLLYQLRDKMNTISYLSWMISSQVNQIQVGPMELPPQSQHNQRDLTLQELAKYNGKDGNPAYVAVNGTVYDVTNNAAWAAASHFGLTAGKDLTNEFASCHKGQPILSKLKAVGKLI